MKMLFPGDGYAIRLASVRATSLAAAFLFAFFSSHTQTLVPELIFSKPQLKTGAASAGTNGAVYIFRNVTQGIDALVTINGRSDDHVVLANIDVAGPEQNTSGIGYDNAWQPRVAYNNPGGITLPDWWMEFQVKFVLHADVNKPVSVSQFLVAVMNPGSEVTDTQQILNFYGLQSYTMEKNAVFHAQHVTGTLADPSQSGMEFDGTERNYPDVSTSAGSVMVTSNYVDANNFAIRIGGRTDNGNAKAVVRMHSLLFKSFNFKDPVSNQQPGGLLGFAAQLNGRKVLLDWKTTAHANASHFIVQRSADGICFDDAALMFSEEDDNDARDYQYAERVRPANRGLLYYRLKIVDMHDQCRYSGVVMLNLDENNSGPGLLKVSGTIGDDVDALNPRPRREALVSAETRFSNNHTLQTSSTYYTTQATIMQIVDLPADVNVIKTMNGTQSPAQPCIKMDE